MLARLRGNEYEGGTTALSLGSALSAFRRDTWTINAAHLVNLEMLANAAGEVSGF